MPGGNLDDGRQKLSVSTRTGIKTPQDFAGLMVAERGGYPIYFRQLGEVQDTIKDRTSVAHYDGVPAIGIEVGKQSGGNAVNLGVSNDAIGTTVGILLEGTKTGKFNDIDEQVDVRLRLLGSSREKPSQLDYIQVPTSGSGTGSSPQLVPLSSVAEWNYDTNPSAVHRYERQKEVRISANLDGISLGEFEGQFEDAMESLELPAGVSTGSAGEANEMAETMTSILTAMVLGIAFIFMINASAVLPMR